MSESAFSVLSPCRDSIDLIVSGDILFDEVLTESFCQVCFSYLLVEKVVYEIYLMPI